MNPQDPRLAQHLSSLRAALIARRRATRAQLSQDTGLSTMTIGKLLSILEERGEVRQGETIASGAGRPSTLAQYRADYAHLACISAMQRKGRSRFVMSVYDVFGERLHTQTQEIQDVREDSFDPWLRDMARAGYRIALAAFALPGEAVGDVVTISDFPALQGDRFLAGLRERLGFEILFENDVNAAVYGHAFDGEDGESVAGMYFPGSFPPGAGAVVRGRVLRGRRNFAGEIAHIHGLDLWRGLDYGDEESVARAIGLLLRAYICVLAPESVVLYGDFFTPSLQARLRADLSAHFGGLTDVRLHAAHTLDEDMEKGVLRLGLDRLRALLDK